MIVPGEEMFEDKVQKFLEAVIKISFVAGTLDILCALVQFYIKTGKNPVAVLKFIASGFFGKEAFTDNSLMPIYGLFFHYVIAFSWTALFFFLYPKISFLKKNKFVSGAVYGVFIWIIMTQLILPLSNTPDLPFNIIQSILGIIILILAVGIPISILTEKFYRTKL
jgi:hypothetical protein